MITVSLVDDFKGNAMKKLMEKHAVAHMGLHRKYTGVYGRNLVEVNNECYKHLEVTQDGLSIDLMIIMVLRTS